MNESLRLDEMIANAESNGLNIAGKAEQVIESVKNEKAEGLSKIYDVIVAALESKHLSLSDAQEKISRLDEVSNQIIGYSISKLLSAPFSRELPYIKEKTDYRIIDKIDLVGDWQRLLYINDDTLYGVGGKSISSAIRDLDGGVSLGSRDIDDTERTSIPEVYCFNPKIDSLSLIIERSKGYTLQKENGKTSALQNLPFKADRMEAIEETKVILPNRALCLTGAGRLLEISQDGLERVVADKLPRFQDLRITLDGTIFGYLSDDASKAKKMLYQFRPQNDYRSEEFAEIALFPEMICLTDFVVIEYDGELQIVDRLTGSTNEIELDLGFDIVELQPLPNGRFFALVDDEENQSRDLGNKIVFINADGSVEEIGSRPDGIGIHDAYITKDGKIFTLSSDNKIHIWDGVEK